jgi:hypothetical protein
VQKLFEGVPRGVAVAQVFFVDLPYGEQGLEAVLAARILASQELVFADCGVEVFLSGRELATHLGQHLGDRNHAGVGLTRHGSDVVDLAVGVGDVLILFASTLVGRKAVECLPHLLRFFELVAGLLLPGRIAGGQRRKADAAQNGDESNSAQSSQASASQVARP